MTAVAAEVAPGGVRGVALRLRVRQLRLEAAGVVSLLLEDAAGLPLTAWEPGAHVSLRLPSGLVRQYSLCGSSDSAYRIAVLDVAGGRGGSAEVHRVLRPGDVLDVEGPVNRFPLEAAESYLFLAGGIGITPILTMVRAVAARGGEFRLVYGARSLEHMAFVDELRSLCGDRLALVAGIVDLEAELAALPSAAVYCCGPEPMLAAVTAACEGRELHIERFAAAPPPPAAGPGAFRVVLARSGRSLEVAEDRSILETLHAAGVDVPCSCEQGICGTCETRVLEGTPDHRDALLTDAERAAGTSMMVCVSRSLGEELVLDL